MNNTLAARLTMELVWWLITALVIYMVISPMYSALVSYPFLIENSVFIIVFITFTRYIFLLKYTYFTQSLPFKLFLLFGSLPLLIYLLYGMFGFQVYLNEEGIDGFVTRLYDIRTSPEEVETLYIYFRREMVFFATGSIIITVLTPFRMLMSIWRVYNKTGKV